VSADFAALVTSALAADLEKLRDQLRELADPLTDEQLWQRPLEPGNSVGHLILHLTGNLNHFVGAHLAGSGYVRDRDREFTDANPPSRTDLFAALDAAVALFRCTATGLTAQQLTAPHPEARFGTVLQALIALLTHFAMHRGQVSYIVRLLIR